MANFTYYNCSDSSCSLYFTYLWPFWSIVLLSLSFTTNNTINKTISLIKKKLLFLLSNKSVLNIKYIFLFLLLFCVYIFYLSTKINVLYVVYSSYLIISLSLCSNRLFSNDSIDRFPFIVKCEEKKKWFDHVEWWCTIIISFILFISLFYSLKSKHQSKLINLNINLDQR